MNIRVLIADDHGMIRQGIRMYLSLEPSFETVGEAGNGAEAIELALRLHPDVVLMDLLMPGIDGIAATRVIRRELPDTQVVAVTSVLETESIVAAIRAGAIGYVLKNANAADLCRAVKAAAEGQVELSPAAQQRLLRELIIPASPEVLTDRETEVLRMVAHGCSNKEIARCLDIAEKTVKNHVASILDKLGVASRTQAAMFAVHAGLVAAEPLAYAE